MDNERDKFDDWLKERFDNFEPSPPADMFDRINDSVENVAAKQRPLQRRRELTKWISVAAALLVVVGTALLLMPYGVNNNVVNQTVVALADDSQLSADEQQTQDTASATEQNIEPATIAVVSSEASSPALGRSGVDLNKSASGPTTEEVDKSGADEELIAQNDNQADKTAEQVAANDDSMLESAERVAAAVKSNDNDMIASNETSNDKTDNNKAKTKALDDKQRLEREAYRRLLNGEDPFAKTSSKRSKERKSFAAQLFAANTGTGRVDISGADKLMAVNMFSYEKNEYRYSSSTIVGNRFSVPSMAPIIMNTEASLTHYMPVNAGVALSIPIRGRWSLETGLNMAYLYSRSNNSGTKSEYSIRREQYSVGIPLSVACSVVELGAFDIYAKAGGMVERVVSATDSKMLDDKLLKKEQLSVAGVQPSLLASAGVVWQFVNHVGLYCEPGLSYYFKVDGQPANYRTQNPLNFSMTLGVKFLFN